MCRSRQLCFSEWELPALEKEAIEYIRAHEPEEGYFVGFSGGKDSIALLHLVRMSGVKYFAYHNMTSIDPPEVIPLIRKHYQEVTVIKPKVPFYKLVERRGPPSRTVRYCCSELKENASKDIPLQFRLMGIRAEESIKRASRGRESTFKLGKLQQTTLKPIFHWPEWAVWELIEKYRLPYPSLYDEGFHRLGCVCCPFSFGTSAPAKMRMEKSMARFPGIWRAFKNASRVWWDTKDKTALWGVEFEDWWNAYLTGKSIKNQIKISTQTSAS